MNAPPTRTWLCVCFAQTFTPQWVLQCHCRGCSRTAERSNSWSNDLRGDRTQVPWAYRRTVEELDQRADPPAPGPEASAKKRMKHRLETNEGRERYVLRKQTIEPIFGIIKETLGFRCFSLRGIKNVRTEWTLVTLADNLKRLFHMGSTPLAA